MPPSLTYSTTASSSYTVGGTATGGAVDWWTAHQGWDPLVYHYSIPDTATAAYGWSNADALDRAMEIVRRELRKEPDQSKIKELL